MRKFINDIVYYQFFIFEEFYPELKHIVTTRIGGYSKKPYNALNLSFNVGDSYEDTIRNRGLVCNKLGYMIDSIVAMRQSHGANVRVIDAADKGRGSRKWEDGIANTDGMITI